MGVYNNDNGVLSPIAGRGKAEYGASTVRTGSFEIQMNITDSTYDLAVTFSTPMPDNDYLVDLTCHNQHGSVCILNGTKTANGFTARASCVDSTAVGETMLVSYTAFKLYTDTEYNGLLNNQRYSTSEINTGKTWIDGKPIYRKVVEVASFTSGTQAIPHGITNLDKMVNIYGVAKSGTTQLTMPYDYRTDGIDQNTNIFISGANVNIRQNWDASSYSGYIILEYTKTS